MGKVLNNLDLITGAQVASDDRFVLSDVSVPKTKSITLTELRKAVISNDSVGAANLSKTTLGHFDFQGYRTGNFTSNVTADSGVEYNPDTGLIGSASFTGTGRKLVVHLSLPISVNTNTCRAYVRINNVLWHMLQTSSTTTTPMKGTRVITGLPAGTFSVGIVVAVQAAGNVATVPAYWTVSVAGHEI